MLGRGHGPQDVRAGPPRRLDWDAAPDLSYCQFFGFAPNGGSILFLNRPPPGEKDQVAELALAAETSDEDPA